MNLIIELQIICKLENNMKTKFADILELSIPERIDLVRDIWDSIAEIPEAVVLSEAQKNELDKRLEAVRSG